MKRIPELLIRTAERFPDTTAYISGSESITYAELIGKAQNTADLLIRHGNDPVVIIGGKECTVVVSIIACILSGRTYVPVDRFTPESRIEQIISASGASLVLSEDGFLSDSIGCLSLSDLGQYRDHAPHPTKDSPVYMIFTSGTTGEPKGVPISHENLESFVTWLSAQQPLSEYRGINVLNQASFSFDLSAADLYYSLTNGHTLTALGNSGSPDLAEVYDTFRTRHVNLAVMTPTFMKLCLTEPDFREENCPDFRCVYFCGEQLETKTVRKLKSRFPDLIILNAYGPTECTSAVSIVKITEAMLSGQYLPVGESGNFASDITVENGEIVIRGKSVFSGYLGSVTGCHFTETDENGNQINGYRTGDMGKIDGGYLYCLGRLDSQIKYKGYRIEPGDIERNITKIEGIADCAVIPLRSTDGIVKNLAAYIVTDGEHDAGNIQAELGKLLPGYMIPKIIKFIDALPVNKNGKTDRKALEKL